MIKILFYLLPLLAVYLPDLWVRYIFKKNNKIFDDMPFTGTELGHKILKEENLEKIPINTIKGTLIDNYDPVKKEINITDKIYNKKSITSLAVVAHEIGHAIQDRENYKPLRFRQVLLQKTKLLQGIGSLLFFIGLPSIFAFTKSPLITFILGILILGCFSTNFIIHLFTLRTEFDASFNKALPILKKYVPSENLKQCRSVLIAAALTYVSNSLISILRLRILLLSFISFFRR
tara:strand:- start:122 stop:820 length:699 start_codon:yes stop_codon:yes gene_type:complete